MSLILLPLSSINLNYSLWSTYEVQILQLAVQYTPPSDFHMFPTAFLLLTFTHPTQWPSQAQYFLTSPVLCCLGAIAYTVPPAPTLPTQLWILWSFEVQVRFPFLHEGFLISELEIIYVFIFWIFKALVQQSITERVGSLECKLKAWLSSFYLLLCPQCLSKYLENCR